MATPTTITRGLTYTEGITVTTPAGVADDLTGGTFLAEIRDRTGAVIADISTAFTLRTGEENIVDFELDTTDTWSLPEGCYIWDLLVEIDGVRTFLIPTEQIKITTPSTRPEEA
jgi:hypothetical protein